MSSGSSEMKLAPAREPSINNHNLVSIRFQMSIEYSNRFMDFIGTPFRFIISFARFLKESVVTIGTEKEYQGNYGGRCFEDVIKEWASRPVIDEDINGKLF